MAKPGQAHKILIADDDDLLVQLLEHKLVQNGLDVISVGDGEAALETARAVMPDLIVLDGMMPGVDGFEVLRQLKESERTKDIIIVMLTARRQESEVVSGLSLGADEYLVKPFMPEELLVRISRLLETRVAKQTER